MPKRIMVNVIDHPQHHMTNGGRFIHHVRQSDIKRFELCADNHRRHLLGLDEPEMVNDSALLGTTFARYPEAVIRGIKNSTAWEQTFDYLEEEWFKPTLNQVTFSSFQQATKVLAKGCLAWQRQYAHKVPKFSEPEKRFSVPVYEDIKRTIIAEGTSDLWLPNGSIWDWKFSGQSYVGQHAWTHERGDCQPAHYVMARAKTNNATAVMRRFLFVNIRRDDTQKMAKETVIEELPIQLSIGDLTFHIERMVRMCKFIEKMTLDEPWPLNGIDSWHCSNVWCTSWDECRGKHLGDDPWGLAEKRKRNNV